MHVPFSSSWSAIVGECGKLWREWKLNVVTMFHNCFWGAYFETKVKTTTPIYIYYWCFFRQCCFWASESRLQLSGFSISVGCCFGEGCSGDWGCGSAWVDFLFCFLQLSLCFLVRMSQLLGFSGVSVGESWISVFRGGDFFRLCGEDAPLFSRAPWGRRHVWNAWRYGSLHRVMLQDMLLPMGCGFLLRTSMIIL